MTINFLGTWEQKENKTGNTGTKAYFREHGTPKSKKYFYETREHKENFVGEKIRNRKGIRNPESNIFLLLESGIQGF